MNQVFYKPFFYVIAGVSALIVLTYFFVDPTTYSFLPSCPFHELFGLDCPGCGSQRAFHSLLHGKIIEAADYNLLFVLATVLFLIYYLSQLVSFYIGKAMSPEILSLLLKPKFIISICLIFWILRNIPIKPFSYLAA